MSWDSMLVKHVGVFLVCFMLLLTCNVNVCATSNSSDSVKILSFSPHELISKPGQPVTFAVDFLIETTAERKQTHDFKIEIWISKELDKPFLAVSDTIKATNNKHQSVFLQWEDESLNVFGHHAVVKFFDHLGVLLAEKECFFDVADIWTDVIRTTSRGANTIVYPGYSDMQTSLMIKGIKDVYLNAFQIFTFSPLPYELAPDNSTWPYQYQNNKKKVQMISKERIQYLGDQLHKNGIKFVAYNEASAAFGPDEMKVYLPVRLGKPKLYSHYFSDKGMFVPNSLKIAAQFGLDLSESIKMFHWDGILMDSATECLRATSLGVDRKGNKLTNLSLGEVGYKYLKTASELSKRVNPEFRFLSQNATTISNIASRLPDSHIYQWIKANGERLKIRRYSELVDLYTLEIDASTPPRDGRYPKTYKKMAIVLNSIIETTQKPLLIWAHLAPPWEYSVAHVRPYLSLLFASRVRVHDHWAHYGGPLSGGRFSPVSKQIIQYNRFMARFSWYLWDPKLRWLYDPHKDFRLFASRSLLWDNLVYERDIGNGRKQTIINVINTPANNTIIGQKEIPPVAQNITLAVRATKNIEKVTLLQADKHELQPLELIKDGTRNGFDLYRIPPLTCWHVLILEGKK